MLSTKLVDATTRRESTILSPCPALLFGCIVYAIVTVIVPVPVQQKQQKQIFVKVTVNWHNAACDVYAATRAANFNLYADSFAAAFSRNFALATQRFTCSLLFLGNENNNKYNTIFLASLKY